MEQFLYNFPHLCTYVRSMQSLQWTARWFPTILDGFLSVPQTLP